MELGEPYMPKETRAQKVAQMGWEAFHIRSYTLTPTRWAAFKSRFYRPPNAMPRFWPAALLNLVLMAAIWYFTIRNPWSRWYWLSVVADFLCIIPVTIQIGQRQIWLAKRLQQ